MSFRTGDHRIYVNVGLDLSEDSLRNYFGRFGRVVDVYLPRSKQTSAVLGYGFVTFDSRDEVDAVLAVATHLVGGQQIGVNRAGPRPKYGDQEGTGAGGLPHGTGPRLYVGGVPRQLSEEDLKEHFGRWGQVTDVYFPPQKSRKRSSYCFVKFSTYQEARRAYTESQRRVKGMDVEAINMAKDRVTNQKGGELAEAVKRSVPTVQMPVVGRKRDVQPKGVGGILSAGAAQMPVVDLNSSFVPVHSVSTHMTGSMGGPSPLLINGGSAQQAGIPMEHSGAILQGMNEQQNIPITSGGIQPSLVADTTMPVAHVVGLTTTTQQSKNMGRIPSNMDVGVLQFHNGNPNNMVVPMASAPGPGAPSAFVKPASHPAVNMISGSPMSLMNPVERMSGYSVGPAFACANNPSVRNPVDPQTWTQGPYKIFREGQKWMYTTQAPLQPIGGHGPQRLHHIHRRDTGFVPY